jgi:uncharacterized protein
MKIAETLLKAPIHLYRATIKPWTGLECRHLPTCSEYSLDAIDQNGAWGTSGFDPPPDLSGVRHAFRPWLYGDWRGRGIRRGVGLKHEKL